MTRPNQLIRQEGRFFAFPGFCDVHVHFREPGFSYKETILTGSMAAARGGYTAVCAMPNLNPVPDSDEHLRCEEDAIARAGDIVSVYPYGALTVGEKGRIMADIEVMAPRTIAFSDDGKGIQDEETMRALMTAVAKTGKILAAHCEDMSLVGGGYIHAGRYAALNGHAGIPSESEWKPIERDLRLAKETGCPYHVCHVSCEESVALIRRAKADGVDVTCETAPHYLILCDDDLQDHGRFRMNPPIRSAADRDALVEGLIDGTIDIIATDHAPHSAAEKSGGLRNSAFGVTGLECAFPALYTHLVRTGVIPLEKLIDLMSVSPRRRFKIPLNDGDECVWDLDRAYVLNPEEFLSLGKSTPFEGFTLYGRCMKTIHRGKIVYGG